MNAKSIDYYISSTWDVRKREMSFRLHKNQSMVWDGKVKNVNSCRKFLPLLSLQGRNTEFTTEWVPSPRFLFTSVDTISLHTNEKLWRPWKFNIFLLNHRTYTFITYAETLSCLTPTLPLFIILPVLSHFLLLCLNTSPSSFMKLRFLYCSCHRYATCLEQFIEGKQVCHIPRTFWTIKLSSQIWRPTCTINS